MKTNHRIIQWLTLAALLIFNLQSATAFAQGTVFTYQGRLNDSGQPANGTNYGMAFYLYDAPTNGNLLGNLGIVSVTVSNGLFTTPLDFGNQFDGTPRWLEISVQKNGGSFTTLAPRQQILPTPYAIMANTASNLLGTLPAAQLSGTLPASVLAGYSGTVTLTNGGNSFNGTFSGSFGGSGAGLTGVPGTFTWQNVTGTSQQAQPNTGYLANNAAQVTITLPTAPNLGDIVRVSGVGAGGWIIAQNAGQCIQAGTFGVKNTNWNTLTNWLATSAPMESWQSIASSTDGTRLIAAARAYMPFLEGGVYTSTDSGLTWTLTSAPGLGTNNWCSVASSADGTKLAAGVLPGGIYTSTNSGVTWAQTSAPSTNWDSITSSADGVKLVAVVADGGIYTSTNSGGTWIQTSAPAANLGRVACSADGAKLAATVSAIYGGGIYTSTNSGVTWTQTSAPSTTWRSIASSADGTKLVAVVAYNGGIYTSTDSGVTWTQTSAPCTNNWMSIASSSDGTKLAAGMVFGELYTSADSGGAWSQGNVPNDAVDYVWTSIASSADGAKLAACSDSSPSIWTAQATIQTTTTPGTPGCLTGGQNTAIELQYIGNGQWLPLSHEGTISAY